MRYRLRTLLIVLGVLPPLAAAIWLEPVACAFYGFLLACFMAATFCAVNFKRVMRRAFDLPPRRKESEYGCPMHATIRDVLWLTVVVGVGLGWWTTRRELAKANVWKNRTGALEAVLADDELTVEWDKSVARVRNKDGSEAQTLLIESFPPRSP